MYRSVIIGCGAISSKHADAIINTGNALIAACDTDSAALSNFCKKYNCRGYADYKAMLDKEMPDAVHICLPHYLHFEAADYALSKDIAVFLEKPPAVNESELERLYKYSDKKLTVCFQNRFNATTESALEIIRSGKYGKLVGANAYVTWNRYGDYYTKSDWRGKKRTEGGSVLINQAIHTLDLLCFLLGSPTAVRSTLSELDHPYTDTEDTAFSVIDFSDKRATFFATTCAVSSSPATVTLVFENARVQFDSKTLAVYKKPAPEFVMSDVTEKSGGKECWGDSHQKIISMFYDFLGGAENPCSLNDCRDTMNLLFEIYKGDVK